MRHGDALWPLWAQAGAPLAGVAVFVALVLAIRHGIKQSRRMNEALRAQWQLWLMRRFGPPLAPGAPQAQPFVGLLKGHRVLRETVQIAPPHRNQPQYTVYADALVCDEQGRFWHVLYHATPRPAQAQGKTTRGAFETPTVLRLNELRARRALFNSPQHYQRAFGEMPTREHLDAWRAQHPEYEPRPPASDSGW